jgi:molecular chaperone GrpE
MEDNKNPFGEAQEENTKEVKEEKLEQEVETQEESTEQEQVTKDDFEQKYEDLNNKYIRLAADFDNFRKRTQSEKEALAKYACADVLSKLTVVLDTFDRAAESLKDVDNCETVKQSYEVAYKQLVDILKKVGLEELEAIGKEFNPNEHEAISQLATDEFEPNTVAYVAQKGYKMGDKIIRPALVAVAKEKEND